MKALKDMTSVEKGKLLADLFPDEIPGILEAIERRHYILVKDKDVFVRNWNKIQTVDDWYAMAHDVYSKIKRQRKQLIKSRRFAEQLFDGNNAIFTIDCIVKYANNERSDSHIYYVVTALFDSDWTLIE